MLDQLADLFRQREKIDEQIKLVLGFNDAVKNYLSHEAKTEKIEPVEKPKRKYTMGPGSRPKRKKKDEITQYRCLACGQQFESEEAPQTCPKCQKAEIMEAKEYLKHKLQKNARTSNTQPIG